MRPTDRRGLEVELLDLIGGLVTEVHPGFKAPVSLDSRLERDLGLDSLARFELQSRIERRFAVHLDEQVLLRAETPNDLLAPLLEAVRIPEAPPASGRPLPFREPFEAEALPRKAATLQEVLEWHARVHGEWTHLILLDEGDRRITYGELLDGSRSAAAALQGRGTEPGQPIGLMLPTGRDFFIGFFGILLAGGVPVPLYPPFRPSQRAEHLERQAGILKNAGAPVLIATTEDRDFARALKARVPALRGVLTAEDCRSSSPWSPHAPKAADLALLQYTSGSTGQPKGVMLTHANLMANIRAMGQITGAGPRDVFVSWLPLYHDMGLIGAWLGSLYFAMPLAVMAPWSFLARPERWLWGIYRHHGTLAAAPNFAYELCLRRIADADIAGLDLGSLRLLLNGAEPVSPQTVERFAERFRPFGFRPEAMTPVYGLAEAAVGLTFTPPGRGPLIDRVRREPFVQEGRAEPGESADPACVRFVSCGKPLPRHEVRIVDPRGAELPERHVGRLEFRGPSTTSGYFNNPQQSARLFRDGWLDSGDLAYLAGGEVYVTGRVKDIIIRTGRNIVPQELEEAVGDLRGVRKGCVAAFPATDAATGSERLVLVAETGLVSQPDLTGLRDQIQMRTVDLLGLPPDDIVLAPAHTVPKTSSGKIRRAECRLRYEHGELLAGAGANLPWADRLGLLLARSRLAATGRLRHLGEALYAAYAWLVFEALAILVFPLSLLPLAINRRRRLLRAAGRLLVRLVGIPIAVSGRDNLPRKGPFILVANHASYLDALALEVAVGPEADYVATSQLLDQPFPRLLLPRLGVLFVDPRDPSRAERDTGQLAKKVGAGRSLMVFPEAGISGVRGLRSFHLGAFLVAALAGVPVVPVSIRGTRGILPPFNWLPRPGAIQIAIGRPIAPQANTFGAAVQLRDAARHEILRQCGEPDIS